MTDRVIPCPECKGKGRIPMGHIDQEGCTVSCGTCFGRKTIPDRRAVSAAERAVERIKAYVAGPTEMYGDVTKLDILKIINEEASRG